MIPRGFLEIRAVEHPPVIAREYLARGAVVKYMQSRPLEIVGEFGAMDFLMVHEFKARAGHGLSFRLAGTPDLNAKMWAVRPGWTIWLQYMGVERVDALLPGEDGHAEHLWHLGGILDVPALRELMRTMEPDHRVLDHGIAVEAGIYRTAELGYLSMGDDEPISLAPAAVEARKSEDRPELPTAETFREKTYGRKPLAAVSRDLSDEDLELPPVDRAARPIHALLRSLLKDGAKPREFVEQKMREAGFSRRQMNRARDAVGVVAKRRGVKGRAGGGVWLLELPGPGKHHTLTRTADVVKLARRSREKVAASSTAASSTAPAVKLLASPSPAKRRDDAPRGPAGIIQQAVAREWGVTVDDLRSEIRTTKLTAPRHVAMYLMRELLRAQLDVIGAAFGGRDRSTVIHGIERVLEKLNAQPVFAQRVGKLRAALERALEPSIAAVTDTHR